MSLKVVQAAGLVLIHDSIDPDKVLVIAAADWRAFLASDQAGTSPTNTQRKEPMHLSEDYKEGRREGRDDYLSKTRPYLPGYVQAEADHPAEFLRGYAEGWDRAKKSTHKETNEGN